MRLFKYVRTPEAAVAIARGSLKFTPIDQLNDPMEVFPFFEDAEVRASLESLRRDGCSAEQFHWLRCQQNLLELLAPEMMRLRLPDDPAHIDAIYRLAIYDHLPLLKEMLVATIQTIRSKVGILSLSERADCVPMWAHYAKEASGFIVAIDGLDRCYPGDETGSLNVAKPVLYSERFLGMTFDPPSQDRVFFSKIDDWRYEREWRVVRALDRCRSDGSAPDALRLHDIPRHHASAVICGWNVPDEVYQAMRRDVADVNPEAVVARTKIEEGRIVLDCLLPPQRDADSL